MLLAIATGTAWARSLPDALWPMLQYSPDRNAVFDTPDWNVSWKVDTAKDCTADPSDCFQSATYVLAEINGGLSIVGTTLYAESYDRRLYAFDARTGVEKWSAKLDNIAMNAPLVADGRVIVGGGGASVTSVDARGVEILGRPGGDDVLAFDAATGAPDWTYHTGGENMPTGAVVGSTYVFTDGDQLARALDVGSGRELWSTGTDGRGVMSSLVQQDGVIYGNTGFGLNSSVMKNIYLKRDAAAAEAAGRTWAMRAADGTYLWQAPYGHGLGSPALGGGMVFVESSVPADWSNGLVARSEVVALDAATGRLAWKYESGPGMALSRGTNEDQIAGTYADGVLYQSLPYTSEFAAFDAATGRIRWKIPTRGIVKMSGVVAGGRVYVGDTKGNLYVLDAATGAPQQILAFPSIFDCSSPLVVGRTLFIANGSALYAIRLSDLAKGIVPR